MQKNMLLNVSIVVPTINRKDSLRRCLKSLYKLDYPASQFEIIVVDNGSTDGTTEMIHKEFPRVKLIIEKRKNSCYARNAGWKKASNQIVAFTDDDCIVDPCWLRVLVSGFTSAEIVGVGGPLLLLLGPKSVVNKFDGTPVGNFDKGSKTIFTRELITANLAVRHKVFEKYEFDVSLAFTALEDIDFCRRLTSGNCRLLYIPSATVYHNVDPGRLAMSYLLKRAFFSGLSIYIYERKSNDKIILIPRFLRATISGCLVFLVKRKVLNIYWLVECLIGFLSSLFLVSSNLGKPPKMKPHLNENHCRAEK